MLSKLMRHTWNGIKWTESETRVLSLSCQHKHKTEAVIKGTADLRTKIPTIEKATSVPALAAHVFKVAQQSQV